MNKFIAFSCTILYMTLLCIFFTESTDVLSLKELQPEVLINEDSENGTLSWQRLPYPCYYEVEILTKNPDPSIDHEQYHLLKKEYTFKNSFKAPSTGVPTYYRISGHGMFKTVGKPSKIITTQSFDDTPFVPTLISHYDVTTPANTMPFLIWHTVPGGVYYELELLSHPPENPNGITLSNEYSLLSTRAVFTNGWQADLKEFAYRKLFWRVRALDFAGNPVGVFSNAEEIHMDSHAPLVQKPIINNFDRMPDFTQPLYPVYNWIPLHNISKYEVELLNAPPDEENNTEPSSHRIWSKVAEDAADCYDEYARMAPGIYYWRVRALDANGNTIGVYSDSEQFTVTKSPLRVDYATFGDSITHGGGALSYSPANLEYSYQSYLDFPALNLGRSGDTSTTTAERFDTDVLPYRPRNLIILCGSNSIRAGTPASTIIHDIITIRMKCEANDIRPIFLTLMPINPTNIMLAFNTETADDWHEDMTQVNAFIRKQPYYIDLEPYFYDNQGFMATQYATDGLHPDIKGKQLMAQIVNAHKDLFRH